ncbi:MAG: hypothetical protein C5S48_00540 [Candidatus Methanogaster sp.]|nr:MAG: hypothetical protein C5S48_00540 [ANME-2 cluster archaeon]
MGDMYDMIIVGGGPAGSTVRIIFKSIKDMSSRINVRLYE